LTATVLTGLLANRAVTSEFNVYVTRQGTAISDRLIPVLQSYYLQTGSWDGIDELFAPVRVAGRPRPGISTLFDNIDTRAILTDANKLVVYDSSGGLKGRILVPELAAAARPIALQGKTIGLLFVGRVEDNAEQRAFLGRVNRGLLIGGLAAG